MPEKRWKFALISEDSEKEFRQAVESALKSEKVACICIISPATRKKRSDRIEWFRNFAYCDLGQLSEHDQAALYAEYESWLNKGSGLIGVVSVSEEKIQKLRDHQAWFSSTFQTMMAQLERTSLTEVKEWTPWGINALRLGAEPIDSGTLIENEMINLMPDVFPVSLRVMPYLKIPIEKLTEKKGAIEKFRRKPYWREVSRIITSTDHEGMEYNYFLFQFLNTLNGLGLDMCVRCEECGQWFFNLSMRRKIFCSNRCAKRKDMRDYRRKIKESGSDKHLSETKEGRLRARLSYLNMRAKSYPKYTKKAAEVRAQLAEFKKQKRSA